MHLHGRLYLVGAWVPVQVAGDRSTDVWRVRAGSRTASSF